MNYKEYAHYRGCLKMNDNKENKKQKYFTRDGWDIARRMRTIKEEISEKGPQHADYPSLATQLRTLEWVLNMRREV